MRTMESAARAARAAPAPGNAAAALLIAWVCCMAVPGTATGGSSAADAAPSPASSGRERGPLAAAGMTLEIRDGRVVVAEVSPGSPAAAAAILPLDVVVAVDGRNVVDLHPLDPESVLALFEWAGRQEIRLLLGRGGGLFGVELRPPLPGVPGVGGPEATADRIRPGAQAPTFVARDLAGREVSLQALRGRPVLIDFWASWCAPCRITALTVRRLADQHAGTLAVIGVSLDHDRKAFEAFARNRHLPGQQIFEGGPSGPIARLYGVPSAGIPYAVLVDGEGRIALASPSFEEIEAALRRIVVSRSR